MTEEVTTPAATPQAEVTTPQPEATAQTAAPAGVSSAYGTTQATPDAQTQASASPSPEASSNQSQSTGDPYMDLFMSIFAMSLQMTMRRDYFASQVLLHQQIRQIMEKEYESIYQKQQDQDKYKDKEKTSEGQNDSQKAVDAVNTKMEKMGDDLQQSIGQQAGITIETASESQMPAYVIEALKKQRNR